MKHLFFTVALSTFVLSLLWGIAVRGIFAQTFQVSREPICYMETADGNTIDLGNLCGTQSGSVTPQAACDSDSQTVEVADLLISNVNYDGNLLTGRVTNQSCKTVTSIKVNYQVLDVFGNAIDNGYIEAMPVMVEPGKVASFEGRVMPGAKVEATYVEWSE